MARLADGHVDRLAPGAWESSSARRRGKGYSGRFENRSGNAIICLVCRGRDRPVSLQDTDGKRPGPEKGFAFGALEVKIVTFSSVAGDLCPS
jgi:hypothetical protein